MSRRNHFRLSRTTALAGCLLAGLAVTVFWTNQTRAAPSDGVVYVATNQPSGNKTIQFRRASDGSRTKMNEVGTGGSGGTGNGVGALDPLGSQDSLVLSGSGSLLLVVNAGSDSLASIRASSNGLRLLSTIGSNGSFPNSVAVDGNLVYVLNAHGTPNVAGFRLNPTGRLIPLAEFGYSASRWKRCRSAGHSIHAGRHAPGR